LRRYEFNQDDVNHIVLNRKGTMLAAADDTGDVKVIDVEKCKLHKTLRGGHENVRCASCLAPRPPSPPRRAGCENSSPLLARAERRVRRAARTGDGFQNWRDNSLLAYPVTLLQLLGLRQHRYSALHQLGTASADTRRAAPRTAVWELFELFSTFSPTFGDVASLEHCGEHAAPLRGLWLELLVTDSQGFTNGDGLRSTDGFPSSNLTRRKTDAWVYGHARMQICSAVQFRPHHPWEVMSGGLDSRMLRWDYGSGRVRHSWNMNEAEADGGEGGGAAGQMFNPPMVHSVAVGAVDDHLSQRVVAVARGDGKVVVYDVAAAAATTTTRSGGRKGARGGGEGTRAGKGGRGGEARSSGRPRSVAAQHNGHAASATHVAFARFSGGRHLVSGGNDARLLLWDWAAAAEAAEAEAEAVEDKAEEGIAGVDPPGVHTVAHGEKVNWLCTSTDHSHAVFVADTSPQLSVYALAA